MKQPLISGRADALNASTVEYNQLVGGIAWNATIGYAQVPISAPGTISDLYVELSAAPGAGGSGDSYTFVLMVDGVASDLSVAISETATYNSDTEHSISVSAGSVVAIRCTPANTPANTPNAQWGCVFTSTAAYESNLLAVASVLDDADSYGQVTGGSDNEVAVEANASCICPTSGTIQDLYLKSRANASGAGLTVTLRKGGLSQTLTATIASGASTASDTAHTVSVAAGDVLTFLIPTAAASNTVGVGMTFVAATDGESIHMGGCLSPLDLTDTEYHGILAGSADSGTYWSTTEANHQDLLAIACTVKKLYVKLDGAAGSGDSYVFTLRQNAGNTDIAVTISGSSDTTGNSGATEDTLAIGDNICLQCAPTGSPAAGREAFWGIVFYIATTAIKTVNGLANASISTLNGLARASVKTVNGLG